VTLVDSNILLDLVSKDSNWWQWSLSQLEMSAQAGTLVINDIIYAETSIRYGTIEEFDAMLATAGVTLVPISPAALFRAGKAFAKYRKAGGSRTGVLPDFVIGAHAEVERLPLLTRDVRRYRTYFPNVTLLAPEGL
jgi:predicted nucleic acid-binding protein